MYHLLRKQITLFTIASVCALTSFSQFGGRERYRENHDDKPIYFGMSIGTAHTFLAHTKTPRFLQYDSVLTVEPGYSPCFALGLMATWHPLERWEFRANPQLLLGVSRSFRYFVPDTTPNKLHHEFRKVQSTILSLPVSVKFNSDRINNFRAYVMGGFQFDKDLASNASAQNADDLLKLKKFDYGLHLGMGVNFYLPFVTVTPEIKFVWGMNDLHSPTPSLKFSNTIDKLNSRMIMFSILLEE